MEKPTERETLIKIIKTEIEMVKNNKWLSTREKELKINELNKLIKK